MGRWPGESPSCPPGWPAWKILSPVGSNNRIDTGEPKMHRGVLSLPPPFPFRRDGSDVPAGVLFRFSGFCNRTDPGSSFSFVPFGTRVFAPTITKASPKDARLLSVSPFVSGIISHFPAIFSITYLLIWLYCTCINVLNPIPLKILNIGNIHRYGSVCPFALSFHFFVGACWNWYHLSQRRIPRKVFFFFVRERGACRGRLRLAPKVWRKLVFILKIHFPTLLLFRWETAEEESIAGRLGEFLAVDKERFFHASNFQLFLSPHCHSTQARQEGCNSGMEGREEGSFFFFKKKLLRKTQAREIVRRRWSGLSFFHHLLLPKNSKSKPGKNWWL